MLFNLVDNKEVLVFPTHLSPLWSGLHSSQQSHGYVWHIIGYHIYSNYHMCIGSRRSCGLSVAAIWNHIGKSMVRRLSFL